MTSRTVTSCSYFYFCVTSNYETKTSLRKSVTWKIIYIYIFLHALPPPLHDCRRLSTTDPNQRDMLIFLFFSKAVPISNAKRYNAAIYRNLLVIRVLRKPAFHFTDQSGKTVFQSESHFSQEIVDPTRFWANSPSAECMSA